MASFSHYLVLLVLKLKGVKKDFSQDPIDYLKIRKEDIHKPNHNFFPKSKVFQFEISNTLITEIKQKVTPSEKLILFIHGGAFISGPGKHHWDSIKEIHKNTPNTIWLCDYPKAPEFKIDEISKNLDLVYSKAIEKFKANEITIIGDSVGGTLATALVQRLVKNDLALPKQIILISPVMDASFSNPEISLIDKTDPMLSKTGVLSAKKMCAKNNDLKNVMISPIHGSFDFFPKTILFLAENDITYPDQKIAEKKLKLSNIATEVVIGKNMPHIWPLLPIMSESKLALKKITKYTNI